MANQLGISQRAYSKLENNEIKLDLDKLLKIAEIFEMEASEILNTENNQTNNFNNNKAITNAVVNNFAKAHDELNGEIIQILKDEVNSLRLLLQEKDLQIKDLINKIIV
jgi:transcriptional regulator with XRE-family HTH domain